MIRSRVSPDRSSRHLRGLTRMTSSACRAGWLWCGWSPQISVRGPSQPSWLWSDSPPNAGKGLKARYPVQPRACPY